MQELQTAAEAVRQNLNLTAFDEAAVRALSEFIERERRNVATPEQAGVVQALGCFLGECILRSFGGHWHRDGAGRVGVRLPGSPDGALLNPFEAVEGQLLRRRGPAVLELFGSGKARLQAAVVAHPDARAAAEPARRRTWIPPLPLPPRPYPPRPVAP